MHEFSKNDKRINMRHKDIIDNYDGSMEQLAESIGDLKYDALAQF